MQILIVDDDRDFADSLAEFLELYGHRVDVTYSGLAGVEANRNHRYEAVFMDIGLPGENGIESLSRIKRDTPRAACFLLTGYSADQISRNGGDPGGFEIMTKPINPEALSKRLSKFTNGSQEPPK